MLYKSLLSTIKRCFKLSLLISLVCLLTTQAAQKTSIAYDKYFNYTNSPLTIDGDFVITNTSKKTITAYKLGCIEIKEDNIIIIAQAENSIQTDLPPEFIILDTSAHGSIINNIKPCQGTPNSLTIIEVTFEDGTKWAANKITPITTK